MSDTEQFIEEEVKKYVSNIDRDVYTVDNIPEEVIAVIFAYVSRSPKSFRDNIGTVIQEEQLGQERASKFHEKWVLNYGHASVAEHAAVHVGIEKVSRLFSSVLELSNEYLSFTEYSQRYQKPQRGDFYIPVELSNSKTLQEEFKALCNFQYDLYLKLNDSLFDFLKRTVPVPEGKTETAHLRALEKIAFEDARYALNLSTYTNLGMTANARAIEDSLSKLLSSKYTEVRKRAEDIKQEVRFSVPTLVKYANKNPYIVETRENLYKEFSTLKSNEKTEPVYGPTVNLLGFTGEHNSNPEDFAIREIVKSVIFKYSDLSAKQADDILSAKQYEGILPYFNKALEKLGKFDNPLNMLKLVKYKAEFIISEACWHQLLRHRKVNWIVKDPGIKNGLTIPPNVKEAGVEDLLLNSTSKSEELYEKLLNENLTTVASYVVTNSHNRRLIGDLDLWELYHLINLRMSEGAQWDIKDTISILVKLISTHHPNLLTPAINRLK